MVENGLGKRGKVESEKQEGKQRAHPAPEASRPGKHAHVAHAHARPGSDFESSSDAEARERGHKKRRRARREVTSFTPPHMHMHMRGGRGESLPPARGAAKKEQSRTKRSVRDQIEMQGSKRPLTGDCRGRAITESGIARETKHIVLCGGSNHKRATQRTLPTISGAALPRTQK